MRKIEDIIQQHKFDNQAHQLRVNFLNTASWLKSEISDFLKSFEITQPQFNILRILRGACPEAISTLQIREKMIDKMSDASRMVDRMIKKEWVKKVPCTHDKRLVRVSITELGLNLLKKIDTEMPNLDKVTNNLNAEEMKTLNILLNKLRKD